MQFPTVSRYVFSLAAIIGFAAIICWGVPVYTQDAPTPPTWAFGLMLLAPIGIGFFLMSLQRVFVTEEYIESHFLGFKKHLDGRSVRVLKVRSNGFLLCDAEGKKLFINQWMTGE